MASKRRLRRNGCTGKRQYENQAQAITAVIGYRRRTGDRGMHPYRCNFCRFWHLGH
jgi:hypothetical protein